MKMPNLETINTLKKKYNCNVGYSGHETGLAVSYCKYDGYLIIGKAHNIG